MHPSRRTHTIPSTPSRTPPSKFRAHPITRAARGTSVGVGVVGGEGAGRYAGVVGDAGPGYATGGPVYPPPAPMVPLLRGGVKVEEGEMDADVEAGCGGGSSERGDREGSRERDEEGATPRAHVQGLDPPSPPLSPAPTPTPTSSTLPTLRLLPEALRPRPGGTSVSTTFPLSDADWEQMTSVALAGANKARGRAGGGDVHVDVGREVEGIVGVLPGRAGCDRIWACYVEKLEWQHCVVHPGAFQQMYDTFWAFKTVAERAACTPIAWLALLLAVMSHGLAVMRLEEAKAAGIVEDAAHWRMLCTQLWIASERALALDNFAHAVTLEVVQTLVLLSYRAISLDPKGWFHQAPILAMAIRLAMSIGLNGVVGDKAGDVSPPGLHRRELWRRIWYNIVYLDWRFSVPMAETYFINHAHYNTVPPANMDWSEMGEGTVFRPKARDVFTPMSMFLAKVRNAERVRELVGRARAVFADGGGADVVLLVWGLDVTRLFYDHEVSVNDTITLEPPCLVVKDDAMESTDKKVQWARIGHTLELDYRAIQIHRAFLVADFREARARGVCVDTAEKMLECFVEGKRVEAPSAWWWYGYTACVVLMMEQYYAELTASADVVARLDQKLDNVVSYVAMQRTYDEVTTRAWDGILILETLIAELQKRRLTAAAPAGIKRTHDQIDAAPPAAASVSPLPVTRVASSSPVHAFRKWILNVIPFLKLPSLPGLPTAHPRQRDMDAAFWDAILDIDTELHKSSRRSNFVKA
ncbi:hypothetical protein K439DRAFT_1621530 [Ramaria rubella]|nr:hypothetical protein K439DRAFT_1621530 [Ramaria rubella]